MKKFHKETKTIKAMNTYLSSIQLEGFSLDTNCTFPIGEIIDHDSWIEENVYGVSVQLNKTADGFELFATKYTAKDLNN